MGKLKETRYLAENLDFRRLRLRGMDQNRVRAGFSVGFRAFQRLLQAPARDERLDSGDNLFFLLEITRFYRFFVGFSVKTQGKLDNFVDFSIKTR